MPDLNNIIDEGKEMEIEDDVPVSGTRRDPSATEFVEGIAKQGAPPKKEKDTKRHMAKTEKAEKGKRKKLALQKPLHSTSPKFSHFEDLIPSFMVDMSEFLDEVINVIGDGNCGFRGIAVGLGKDEEAWPEIRQDLLNELRAHEDLYRRVQIQNGDFERMIYAAQWKEGPCMDDVYKWMVMPAFGNVIANKYARPLHFFSEHDNLTFLPHRHGLNANKALALAFRHDH